MATRKRRARTGTADAVAGIVGTARGRLLRVLCGTSQTAAELATRVHTSSNAVRVHLQAMRKAGLVQFEVHRRGVGKPRHVYSLTAAAEYLMSRAYVPVRRAMIDVIRARGDEQSAALLREAGVAMATSRKGLTGDGKGIDRGLELLRELGGSPWAETHGSETIVRAACCPLGGVTRDSSEVCAILKGALSSVTGAPAQARCGRAEHPECAFVISLPTSLRPHVSRQAKRH